MGVRGRDHRFAVGVDPAHQGKGYGSALLKHALERCDGDDKLAYRHSGHPGGLKTINVGDQLRTHPDRVVERAIKGMLPHNTLGRQMLSKLKVYAGPEHPHAAQQPQTYEIKQVAQ